MKKIITLLLAGIILLAACGTGEPPNNGNDKPPPANNGDDKPPPGYGPEDAYVPKEILDAEQKIHDDKINRIISAGKIDKVVLSSNVYNSPEQRGERYDLEATDAEIIDKWVGLIGEMNAAAVPFNPENESGYTLYFYIDDSPINIGGGFVSGNINISGDNNMTVMLKMDDFYTRLQSLFLELEEEMGFPKDE